MWRNFFSLFWCEIEKWSARFKGGHHWQIQFFFFSQHFFDVLVTHIIMIWAQKSFKCIWNHSARIWESILDLACSHMKQHCQHFCHQDSVVFLIDRLEWRVKDSGDYLVNLWVSFLLQKYITAYDMTIWPPEVKN